MKIQSRPIALRLNGSSLQWLLAGGTGLVLGFATVIIADMPAKIGMLIFIACLFLFTAIVYGDLRKLLLLVVFFDIPFPLDVVLGIREDVEALGALGGWNISVTTIALSILYLQWFMELLVKNRVSGDTPLLQACLPLTFYVGIVFLSSFAAIDMQLSFYRCFLLLQIFLLFIYIVGTVRSKDDVLFILTVLLIGILLQSITILGLYKIGHTIDFAGLKGTVHPGPRIGGTLQAPNAAGSYLSFLLIPAMSMMLLKISKSLRLLAGISIGLGIIALTLTLSRGGMIAFTVSAGLFFFIAWTRGWISLKIPLILLGLCTVLLLPWYDVLIARLLGDDAGSAQSRIPMMKLAMRIIADNPFGGVGVNNYSIVMQQYITTSLRGMWLYAVHNKYLMVWAELGTFGILAFIGFLSSGIRRAWRASKLENTLFAVPALGIMTSIIGHMVHMLVDTFNSRPIVQMLWISVALVTAMLIIEKDSLKHSENDRSNE